MKKIKIPLYDNDGICSEPESELRRKNIELFKTAVQNKELRFINNTCLCHNEHPENDIVISEKDRYGFAIPQILCSKCGLIRSGIVLDEVSNRIFYEKYYRGIYLASPISSEDKKQFNALFADQYGRGKRVLSLIKEHVNIGEICKVAEVGCGAGGVLMPFHEYGLETTGYDFDKKYLSYGCEKGLNLIYGDFYKLSQDSSYDLIIINHVLEHFLDPIGELCKLLPKLRIGGYLYVEVPGILNIHRVYIKPISYFQNAHVYNYYMDYLKVMFRKMGLEIIYGDEICRFIVRKTGDQSFIDEPIYDESLSDYPQLLLDYLVKTKKREKWNYRNLKRLLKVLLPKRIVSSVAELVNNKSV